MAVRIPDFDTWRQGFNGSTVKVYVANTTTLAALWADEAGTIPLTNPQFLLTDTDAVGAKYGKFAQPVYTTDNYDLDIDSEAQTGVSRVPLTTLDGQDASNATIKPTGTTTVVALDDFAARQIDALNYGVFNNSAANNTAILQAAIGACGSQGGGLVLLPAAQIVCHQLTLPAAVILCGKGKDITVLQNSDADIAIVAAGDSCGLQDITVDGINLPANSIGFKAIARTGIVMRRSKIKRYDTGIQCKGGKLHAYIDFDVSNCNTGAKLYGDTSESGTLFQYNRWIGGTVDLHANIGIELSYETAEVNDNVFGSLNFDGNLTKAMRINGARFTNLYECKFTGNPTALEILDDDATKVQNQVIGLSVQHSYFDKTIGTSAVTFAGICQYVNFIETEFRGIAFTLTVPTNAVCFIDCAEDSAVTIAGDGTKIVRQQRQANGASKGVTSGNTATKAWSYQLAPGELAGGFGVILGKQRNGINVGMYFVTFLAKRAPSTLAYDNQTANFTVGNILTGGTSGATGRIIADSDSGTTGTLTLHTISGIFVDNEIITDGAGGSAQANGALVVGSVTVGDSDVVSVSETDAAWDASFTGTTQEIQVMVTGNTSQIVEWTVLVIGTKGG